jgi:hypothetical protein
VTDVPEARNGPNFAKTSKPKTAAQEENSGALGEPNGHADDAHPSIAFLDAALGGTPWHLTAIGVPKKDEDDSGIRACTFVDGKNREARAVEWIERHNRLGANIYFSPNPLGRRNIRKAAKVDVVSANWLWAETDPPPEAIDGDKLTAWRKAHMEGLGTMPDGVPPPTMYIAVAGAFGCSGASPSRLVCATGKTRAIRPRSTMSRASASGSKRRLGPLIIAATSIALRGLPGTINHRTGALARVLKHYPDRAYALEDFPLVREDEKPKEHQSGSAPFDLDKLPARLRNLITMGRYEDYDGNRSKAVFATWLVRLGICDADVIEVLLDPGFKISEHLLDPERVGLKPRPYAEKQVTDARNKIKSDEGPGPNGCAARR